MALHRPAWVSLLVCMTIWTKNAPEGRWPWARRIQRRNKTASTNIKTKTATKNDLTETNLAGRVAHSPALCASKQGRRTASASAASVCASKLCAWRTKSSAPVGPRVAFPQQLEMPNHTLCQFMQKCIGVNSRPIYHIPETILMQQRLN